MIEQNGRIHNQIAELLSAYIDEEVTTRERASVETHLATCGMCAQDLATLRQAVTLLGQLPQVAAPRPFTLRESDVGPVRTARLSWWRLPWVQGAIAAVAVLLCVVVAGSTLLLGRTRMAGAPVALQAPAPTQAAAAETAADRGAAEKSVGEAASTPAPAATASYSSEKRAEPTAVPREAPAEAAKAENETVTGEAPPPAAPSPPALAAEIGAPTPTVTVTPGMDTGGLREAATVETTPSPTITLEALPAASTLLEVQDLVLEIEPGVIRVSGRLPLPEGQRLVAELWQDRHPTDWATLASRQVTVGVDGQFSLRLQARPTAPDFDLFAVEPASYEIRLRPVNSTEPVEARIPFDTYSPPPAQPTESPSESLH